MSGTISLFIARVDTRNFEFRGVGATEKQAIAALHKALREHAKQYGLEPAGWFYPEDIFTIEYRAGDGFCDNTRLTTGARNA